LILPEKYAQHTLAIKLSDNSLSLAKKYAPALRHQNTKNYIMNRAYNCSGESDRALQRSPESL
jgi:hypothetical protein